MSIVEKIAYLSVEQYLKGELTSDIRHEYLNGDTFAMVGASVLHNLLASGLNNVLTQHLSNTTCRVFQSDMKVQADNAFYYPDIVISCDEIDPKSYFLTNPVLIVEILSESTKARDCFEKRFAYQSLHGLQEYVLVAQNKFRIEIYRRVEQGWELETYLDDDVVELKSINYKNKIEVIYANVSDYI